MNSDLDRMLSKTIKTTKATKVVKSAKSKLELRSSRAESNWPLWDTCAKTAALTWYAEAIWTLLLFWPMVR